MLPPEINFACVVYVSNALVDLQGGPVVNCAVVMMGGGILALHPPWSSSITNDLIKEGGWYKLSEFLP